MIKCSNCNHDVSEENIFCPDCGARLSAAEAVQEPQETVAPAEPAAPAEEPKAEKKANALAPILAKALTAVKGFLGKAKVVLDKVLDKIPLPRKIVGIIAGGVAALLVLVIVLAVVLSGGKEPEGVLYIKDGDMYFSNLKKDKGVEILDISSDLGNYINNIASGAFTNDAGTRLFYREPELNNGLIDYVLYYRDVKKKEAVKVDSNVSQFLPNAKGTVVLYIKDGNLYKKDLNKGDDGREKIAGDVNDFTATKDLKKILYEKEDSVYLKNGNKDAQKLISEANMLAGDYEKLSWIIYSKENNLYFMKTSKPDDKVKIDSDVTDIRYYTNDGAVYYIKSTESTTKLWDHVEDDLAASDAAMTEPVEPEYPQRGQNTLPWPSYPYSWEYDTTEEYQAAMDKYNQDMAAYNAENDRLDAEYTAAREQYNKDYEAYREALQLWWAKESRDELREELKEADYTKTTYDLYYFNGKESVLVTGNLEDRWSFYGVYGEDKPAVGYATVVSGGEAGKVKISEAGSIWEVRNKLDNNDGAKTSYKAVWKEKSFDLDAEVYDLEMSEDGKKIYYLADLNEEKRVAELYEVKFSSKGLGEAKKIDEDVSTNGFDYVEDAGICYVKDYKIGEGDKPSRGTLYVGGKMIEEDIQSFSVTAFKGGYLYRADGDLKFYKSGKTNTVAQDIYSVQIINEEKLIVLYDYDETKSEGTLGVTTDAKKVTKLDDEVSRVYRLYNWENIY